MSPDSITVGASGAVFGLMGVAVAVFRSRGINVMDTGLGATILLNLAFNHLGRERDGGAGGEDVDGEQPKDPMALPVAH